MALFLCRQCQTLFVANENDYKLDGIAIPVAVSACPACEAEVRHGIIFQSLAVSKDRGAEDARKLFNNTINDLIDEIRRSVHP